MTGHYAHTRFVPVIEWRMSPAETTLADVFNAADYHTIYVGKWHLYGGHAHLPGHTSRKSNRTPVPPAHQGRWTKWLGFEVGNDPFDTAYFEDDDPTPRVIDGFQTDGLFDLSMEQLATRENSDQPFLCVLSVEPPHFPLEAPQTYTERWQDRELTLPPNFLYQDLCPTPGTKVTDKDRETLLQNRRLYYAMIENLDDNVGRMQSFLRDHGLNDNTVVVLLADHGQMDGSHCEPSIIKDHPYEEAVGIPWIVRDPRISRQNGTVDAPVQTEDIFPTLAGLAGISAPANLPGADLTEIIAGETDTLDRDGVLLEFVHDLRIGDFYPYHAVYWRGFRSDRFKYTVLGDARTGGEPWQFYDLSADPYELSNLIDNPSYREQIAQHHAHLRAALIRSGDHYVLAPSYGHAGLNLWDTNTS